MAAAASADAAPRRIGRGRVSPTDGTFLVDLRQIEVDEDISERAAGIRIGGNVEDGSTQRSRGETGEAIEASAGRCDPLERICNPDQPCGQQRVGCGVAVTSLL